MSLRSSSSSPPPVPPKGAPPPSLDTGGGFRLGKYEILKRLAAGGMAEIFLARVSGLPGFQKMVVVKRILPQLATKSDFIEMFLDEARIAATLHHPNVVQMYDVGVVDGNYFIAMEYLHGEDLRSMMKALFKRNQRLPLDHALSILIGVCSGLHYAHEKVGFDGKRLNIVHRDVTPQNIIITYEGGVKLLDFGIAKASNRFGETRFGTLKGKIPYMSPEQCRGEVLDRRSDIFSLGIMLYEISLGRRLYKGASDFEILKKIVEGRITPPCELDPTFDPALETIIMRALEKERDRRYQTAREMQADLESLAREARLYISPIALQNFMEGLFGHKIEAWREAQANGKSLSEHLDAFPSIRQTEPSEDGVEEGGQAGAARSGRQSARHQQSTDELDLDAYRIAPRRSRAPLLVGITLALGVIGGGGLLLRRGSLLSAPWEPAVSVPETPPASLPPPAPPATAAQTHEMPAPAAPVAPRPVAPMVPAQPPPATGALRVRSTPAGAMLFLDGKRLAQPAPTTIDSVEAGRPHVLVAQLGGHRDAVERVSVTAGEVVPVEIRLHHAPRWRPSRMATASSSGAGLRPPAAPPAPAVESERAEPVQPKETPPQGDGMLVVASSPWCNVSVDGVDKGPTPLSLKLPAGRHTVQFSNPEFKISRTLPVTILPNETVRKKLDFGAP